MTRSSARAATPTRFDTPLRIAAALAVVAVLVQGITAGTMVSGGDALAAHGTGAIVLHVLTGLTAIAAFLRWRATGGPVWPVALAGVVFVFTFLQAYLGKGPTIWAHVPGAAVLMLGSALVAAWAFSRPALSRH